MGVASGQVFLRPGAVFGMQGNPGEKREREKINTGWLRVAQLQTDPHKKCIGMINNFDKSHLTNGAAVPPRGWGCKSSIYRQGLPKDFPAVAGGFWGTSLFWQLMHSGSYTC